MLYRIKKLFALLLMSIILLTTFSASAEVYNMDGFSFYVPDEDWETINPSDGQLALLNDTSIFVFIFCR